MGLIDTHTHLDSFARQGALDDILSRARAAGIEAMIAIGTGPDDWTLHRDIARAHPGFVHCAVGLHPCRVEEGWERAVAQIEAFWLAGEPAPVALGETGLDRFHLPKDRAAAERIFAWQRAAFSAQLAIAARRECPLVVHSRQAFGECVEMIDASGFDWAKVVFHCFSEGPSEVSELARRGGRASFTGILTYKNADGVRSAATAQGLPRCMIETDAPYLAPAPNRGRTNEPSYLIHTGKFAAGMFGVSYEEFAATTTANARRFFSL
jgi:TatD DNase family protein